MARSVLVYWYSGEGCREGEHDMSELMLKSGYDHKKSAEPSPYRPMTPQEALALTYGQSVPFLARDGTVRTVRVSGKVRTWKRDPNRIELPVKYGLYESALFVARDGRMVEWGGSGTMLLVAC